MSMIGKRTASRERRSTKSAQVWMSLLLHPITQQGRDKAMSTPRRKSSSVHHRPQLRVAGGLLPSVAKRILPSLEKAGEIIDYVRTQPHRHGWQITRPVADIEATKQLYQFGLEVYRVQCVWPTDDTRMEEELVFSYGNQFLSMPISLPSRPCPSGKETHEKLSNTVDGC